MPDKIPPLTLRSILNFNAACNKSGIVPSIYYNAKQLVRGHQAMQSKKQQRHYWLGGKRKAEQDLFFQQSLDSDIWQKADNGNWDTCWYTGMPDPAVFRKASPQHKINHIPGNSCLTIKSSLYRTVSSMRERVSEQFGPQSDAVSRLSFLPDVYVMPEDYHALQQAALDDPASHWILKPANASRGRGIRVLTDVATAPAQAPWMVQRYLERPHTMRQRKYVLRLYVLISSIEPLRVYLYRQGFAKLASEPYDVNDAENLYSQLTNPDINALNHGAEAPVEFVDLDRYRQWLHEEGHDEQKLFRHIHELVTLTMIAAVEPMRQRSHACKADPRGCYELLGLDCLIDQDLKPWILECNLSPSLGICAAPEDGGAIESEIKRQLVSDMTSLVGLNLPDQDAAPADPEQAIVKQAADELERAGGFQRLYPACDAADYLPFFGLPRLADMILAEAVCGKSLARIQMQPRFASEVIGEDTLALYDERSGQLARLNQSASFIWLLAMQGACPDEIAEQLFEAARLAGGVSPELWTVREDVWNSLAEWAHAGLLMQAAATPRVPQVSRSQPATAAVEAVLLCGAQTFNLRTDSPPLAVQLAPLYARSQSNQAAPTNPIQLQILRDRPGYTLQQEGAVIASRLPLAELSLTLVAHLAAQAGAADEISLDASLLMPDKTLATDSDRHAVVLVRPLDSDDTFGLQLGEDHGYVIGRGMRIDRQGADRVKAVGLPVTKNQRLVPSHAPLAGKACSIETLIFQTCGAGNQEPLQPLSVHAALELLLPKAFLLGAKPLAMQDVSAIARWLASKSLYRLDTSDPTAASNAFAQNIQVAKREWRLAATS